MEGPVLICGAMEAEQIMPVDGPLMPAVPPFLGIWQLERETTCRPGQSGRVTVAPDKYRAYGPQKLLPPQASLERMVWRLRLPPKPFREMYRRAI